MTDFWLQLTVSNVCLSALLAAIAFCVQRHGRYPLLAHLLWLLVLVKMVTPPLITMPVIPIATASPTESVTQLDADDQAPALVAPESDSSSLLVPLAESEPMSASVAKPRSQGRSLALIWASGGVLAALWSLSRLFRFHRLLLRSTTRAPEEIGEITQDLAQRFGLHRAPVVLSTPASLSPFLWWLGGRPRVILPAEVIDRFSSSDLRLILAHELAHLKRRDHWVRWLEWFTCVAFWWNPIAWWSSRNLRVNEELACDLMVLERLSADRRSYANTLLSIAEFLSGEATRPPSLASPLTSGGKLEMRLTMIISNRLPKTPRWLLVALFAVGASVLPLSVAYAQDFGAIERRLGGAVEDGEITLAQAQVMMDALRRSSDRAKKGQEGDRDEAALEQRYMEYQRWLESAVKEGKVSRDDAKKKLGEARQEMFDQRRKDYTRKVDAAKQRYAEYERRLESAVKEGKISENDAKKKLDEARQEALDRRDHDAGDDTKKQRYIEYQRRLESAVKEGKISKNDAKKKLGEARQKIFDRNDYDARDDNAKNQLFMEYQRRLEIAVKEGKISKNDAKKKLGEERRKIFDRNDYDARDDDAKKQRYMEYLRRFEGAVKEGKLSQAEAEKKLVEARRELFGLSPEELRDLRRRYAEIQQGLEAAVKNGKLSKEEAAQTLSDVREDMFRKPADGAQDADRRNQRFRGVQRRLAAAVKEGTISEEDAEKRMADAREGIFGRSAQEARGLRRRYAELERRLEAAVKAKQLSEADAKKKLAEARNEIFGDR